MAISLNRKLRYYYICYGYSNNIIKILFSNINNIIMALFLMGSLSTQLHTRFNEFGLKTFCYSCYRKSLLQAQAYMLQTFLNVARIRLIKGFYIIALNPRCFIKQRSKVANLIPVHLGHNGAIHFIGIFLVFLFSIINYIHLINLQFFFNLRFISN